MTNGYASTTRPFPTQTLVQWAVNNRPPPPLLPLIAGTVLGTQKRTELTGGIQGKLPAAGDTRIGDKRNNRETGHFAEEEEYPLKIPNLGIGYVKSSSATGKPVRYMKHCMLSHKTTGSLQKSTLGCLTVLTPCSEIFC